jgi:hypothetical protein
MVHKKVKTQKGYKKKSQKRGRNRSRSQKGGAWYNPLSWFRSETIVVPEEEKTIINRVGESITSGMQNLDNTLASASTAVSEGTTNLINKTSDMLNTDIALTQQPQQPQQVQPTQYSNMTTGVVGGKSRRHRRNLRSKNKTRSRYSSKKGGRGLGLTYYASPVHDIKTAEPTYLEYYQGGKKYKKKNK